jgi:hypothetical protein
MNPKKMYLDNMQAFTFCKLNLNLFYNILHISCIISNLPKILKTPVDVYRPQK